MTRLFLPEASADTLVILPGDEEQAEAVFACLTRPTALLSVPADWNRDLSPWPAERAFRNGEDFTGGAADFLHRLLEEDVPRAQAVLPGSARLCIAGYSLAGLFALWAAMTTDAFSGAASMSGSLWFDGFTDWAKPRACHAGWVYLSVGDREAKTRNPRMAPVERCTRDTAQQLAQMGIACHFALEPGGHFDDVSGRIARGIDWLTGQMA